MSLKLSRSTNARIAGSFAAHDASSASVNAPRLSSCVSESVDDFTRESLLAVAQLLFDRSRVPRTLPLTTQSTAARSPSPTRADDVRLRPRSSCAARSRPAWRARPRCRRRHTNRAPLASRSPGILGQHLHRADRIGDRQDRAPSARVEDRVVTRDADDHPESAGGASSRAGACTTGGRRRRRRPIPVSGRHKPRTAALGSRCRRGEARSRRSAGTPMRLPPAMTARTAEPRCVGPRSPLAFARIVFATSLVRHSRRAAHDQDRPATPPVALSVRWSGLRPPGGDRWRRWACGR